MNFTHRFLDLELKTSFLLKLNGSLFLYNISLNDKA